MYVREIARATIDNPHADGIMNPGGRGHMLTVGFDEPSPLLLPPPRIGPQFAVTPSPEQFWNTARNDLGVPANNNSIRLYPELAAASIATRETQRAHYLTTVNHGDLHDASEVLYHWEPVSQGAWYSNLWQEMVPRQRWRVSGLEHLTNYWLWFTDARGMYDSTHPYMGQVNCVYDPFYGGNLLPENPCFTWRLWSDGAPDTLTEDGCWSYVELQLWHPGAEYSEPVIWALGIPGPTGNTDKPMSYLGRKAFTDGAWDTEWTVLTEFNATLATAMQESGSAQTAVQWETMEDRFLISIGGQAFNYWVPKRWRADGSENETMNLLLESYPTVFVAGHSCAFNLSPMEFANKAAGAIRGSGGGPTGWVESRYPYYIDENIFNLNGTPSCTLSSVLAATGGLTCHATGWLPGGTYITPTVVSEGTESTTGDQAYRLRVTMEGLGQYERPAAHHVTYNWNPVVSAGTSSPYATQGNNVLLSASGQVTQEWRGANCDLTLEMGKSAADAQVASWDGNNKVQVWAGWETDTSADVAVQFTGYTTSRANSLPADRPERARIELPCMDGFYRLEKHYWLDLGCFEGFTWEETFHRVLHHCSVPDSMISVASECQDPRQIVRMTRLGSDPRFPFQEDTTVVDGLSQLVTSWGMFWGVDQNGTYFLRKPSEYSTYSWTLDDDSLTETDVIYDLRAESTFNSLAGGDSYVNYVFVRVNRGGEEEVAWRWDHDATDVYKSVSHHNSTASFFIGEDWHHVFIGPDEESAEALATRILTDRQKRKITLNFTAPKKVQLFPDDYVRVQATGIGVAENSIFKITSKSWMASALPEGDGSFTANYEAVFVQ